MKLPVFDTTERTERLQLAGAVIESATLGKNPSGDDLLVIEFKDGRSLIVQEQGQVGYFSTELRLP